MTKLSALEEIRALLVQGGWVLFPIFLIGLFAWILLFERYFVYRRAKSRGEHGMLATLRRSISDAVSLGRNAVDNSLKLATHAYDVEFDKAFPTISVCASLAPMLGLLGTVSGMIHVFRTIQLFGFGNPVLIADGISEALLTTQAGLLVSFPIVLANNQLLNRLNNLKAKCWKEALQFENEQLSVEEK